MKSFSNIRKTIAFTIIITLLIAEPRHAWSEGGDRIIASVA